ncbi:MAG: hypothetical protein QGH74_01975, partial [Candidatus Brocadiia bacterium]|nr:hypothetical protein [Candidatus Brocadiia bacterium]
LAFEIFGDHTCDDLPLCLAMSECASGRPLVVPSKEPGFRFLKQSTGETSLLKKPGRRETLYASLGRFVEEVQWTPLLEASVL